MVDDWNIYSKLSHEYDILCRNYAMGKKVTIAYAGKNCTKNLNFFQNSAIKVRLILGNNLVIVIVYSFIFFLFIF